MAIFSDKKWVVRLGFYKLESRRDGLAFVTEATTETMDIRAMIHCKNDDKRRQEDTARVFYPKIFDLIKSMKKQGWSGVVLQSISYQDEDGDHFRDYFYKLINDYTTLRGKVEWKN